ncbi:MAG: hypothetical protein H6Q28_1754, partial [Bacteroidetes bacterium]|nr:hypothetical protein [Bacteroidota bacterium]
MRRLAIALAIALFVAPPAPAG